MFARLAYILRDEDIDDSAAVASASTPNFSNEIRALIEKSRKANSGEAHATAAAVAAANYYDELSDLALLCESIDCNYSTLDAGEEVLQYLVMRGSLPLTNAITTCARLRFVQSFAQVVS